MNNLFEWNKKMKENKILFNLYKLFKKLLIHFISTQNKVIFKVKIIQYLEFSHFISISNIYIYIYLCPSFNVLALCLNEYKIICIRKIWFFFWNWEFFHVHLYDKFFHSTTRANCSPILTNLFLIPAL